MKWWRNFKSILQWCLHYVLRVKCVNYRAFCLIRMGFSRVGHCFPTGGQRAWWVMISLVERRTFLFVSWVKPRAFPLCFHCQTLESYILYGLVQHIFDCLDIVYISGWCVFTVCVCGCMCFLLDFELGRAVAQVRRNNLPKWIPTHSTQPRILMAKIGNAIWKCLPSQKVVG